MTRKRDIGNPEPNQDREDERTSNCTWTHDGWYDAYETTCGEVFYLTQGTPATNRMNYCPYCGNPLATGGASQ